MIKIIKSLVRNHFGFSRAETNGMVLLFPTILLTIFSPFLFNQFFSLSNQEEFFDQKNALKWQKELEANILVANNTNAQPLKPKKTIKKIFRQFEFNPNSVTHKQLLELGFNKRIANNWLKFVKSGGRFYEMKHLSKIYGMDENRLKSLSDYIQFDKKEIKEYSKEDSKKPFQKTFKIVIQEKNLNATSANDLKQISGIGEKLSTRIIKFRDRLGGFHELNQLNDVYGLDSLVIEKITENFHLTDSLSKIDINHISEKDLSKHPYISYKIARVIVNYRQQHGVFKNGSDLLKIHIIDKGLLAKITPYLRFDERSDIFIDQ